MFLRNRNCYMIVGKQSRENRPKFLTNMLETKV